MNSGAKIRWTWLGHLFDVALADVKYDAVYIGLDHDMKGEYDSYHMFRDIRAVLPSTVPIYRIHPPRANLQTTWKERLRNLIHCDEETLFEASKRYAWLSSFPASSSLLYFLKYTLPILFSCMAIAMAFDLRNNNFFVLPQMHIADMSFGLELICWPRVA